MSLRMQNQIILDIGITAKQASLGKIGLWCQHVEKAIADQNEDVCIHYLSRVGGLLPFQNKGFSNLLTQLAPIRNDLVHGRRSKRKAADVITLSLGTK